MPALRRRVSIFQEFLMSMNKWVLRAVAGAALVLAFGAAQATTSVAPVTGVFSLASGTASEVTAGSPALAQSMMADLVINAAGVASFDGPGAAGNTILTFNVTPGALVDGIAYNLSLATIGESWQSEATISFLNSNGDGVVLSAGFGLDEPGSGTYSDSVLLSDFGLSFNVGADGLLIVEFYESFDDVTGAADANWTAGGVTLANIGLVPEPGTYGLMALGMLAVVGAARRRKA
jgi:PEP-CTERM motif